MAIVTCGNRALPRSLDVNIQVSRPQVETTTDLSVVVAVVNDPPFDHSADRIRYYSTISAVEDDFAVNSTAHRMASAFFDQSPRAATMAIAGAFTAAQAAFMVGGTMGAVSGFQSIIDGSFAISIDGAAQNITGLNFSSVTDLDDVAAVVQTALQAVASGGFTAATAVNSNGRLRITSGTTGDASRVTALSGAGAGTDVSGGSFLNALAATATITDGYLPTGLTNELSLIAEAARCQGRFVYGWTLEASYRDTQAQLDASAFFQSRTAILSLVTNNAATLSAASTTDAAAVLSTRGDDRTAIFYSTKVDEYADVALLSYMLHVNYRAANSTVTAKFKDLNGITPEGITESELTVLNSKRCNVLTRIGNVARTIREGVQTDSQWFIDDLINIDNFVELLETEVYNVFLREGKVPYTTDGVALLYRAMENICQLFVDNGTLADRPVADATRENGQRVDPAFNIDFTALADVTPADRAARVGPPFTIDVNLAGAIHSLSINVNAFA